MNINDPTDQPSPSVLRIIRDEVVPIVPWRAAAFWGIALGATFVVRQVYDIFNPTTDYGLRSLASTRAGVAICFGAGFQAAWRSTNLGRGIVVTLVAILIGFVVAILGDLVSVLVISAFRDLDLARELASALEVPLPVMLALGGLVGAVGAAVAVSLTKFRHRTVMQL
jgi:hypothetical protein